MIGLKKTIKDMDTWKNGGMPANKLSPSVSRLVQELRETHRYGRWKTKIILKRDYHIDISESSINEDNKDKRII